MKKIFIAILFLSSINARAAAPPKVKSAPSVNLDQYVGTWFEIATIPQWFQRKCIANVKAEYARAEDGLLSIENSCDIQGGKRNVAHGRAKVVDPATNSKLKVTFVKFLGWQFLLGGNYWILAVDKDYSYAVIGEPGRDYAWILSRTQSLPTPKLTEAAQVLRNQGFDLCKLLTTVQTGGLQERKPLCEVVKTRDAQSCCQLE